MPILSPIARRRKLDYFLPHIRNGVRVLEIGSGDGWVGRALKAYRDGITYVGLDLAGNEPTRPDIVGDIRDWRALGIDPGSFDVIVAFEVIEHVDCVRDCYDILRPGGLLLLTSPVPEMDWLCKLLEAVGLNQTRTSPHSNLTDFRKLPLFKRTAGKNPLGIAQWGVFAKPMA